MRIKLPKISKSSFLIFVCFLMAGMFWFLFKPCSAQAATYYVDATGGLDTNLGTSEGAAWQTIAKVNAVTLVAGDYVYFKRGETWNEQLTIAQSGSAGNPITFDAYGTGNKPIIDGQNTRSYCITFGALSYITINNIQVQNAATRNIWSDGAASGITLDGIDSIGGAIGIYIRAKSSSTYSNITVTGTTGTVTAYGFALQNAASNVTVTNLTVTGANYIGILFNAITNLTATNVVANSNTDFGISFSQCLGAINMTNIIAGGGVGLGNTKQGIYISNSNAGAVSVAYSFTNVTTSYNGVEGFGISTANTHGTTIIINNLLSEHNVSGGLSLLGNITSGTIASSTSRYNGTNGYGVENVGSDTPSNISFTDCICNNNGYDGFTFKGSGSNFVIARCKSYNNGTAGQAASGDGFTSHDTVTNLNIYNSVSYGNLNSGFAMTGSSSGSVYNSTFYNNGSGAFTRGGFWIAQMTGGTGWTIKNNIFSNNYPYEVILDAASLAYQTANYNLYYHPTDSKFATLDYGATDITWTTYHTTNGYETNSLYGDPAFISTSTPDFHLQSSSLAINAGVDVGLTSDYDGITTPVGAGFEMGAYEYLLPFVPTISTSTILSATSIRWNFTDNADNETGFKLYDNSDNLVSTTATANLTYIDETGLSENTQYTGRYVKAYNSYGNSSASSAAASKYTLASAPTSFDNSATRDKITLTIDSFPNASSGSSGYYFYRTDNTSRNSGWINTNSWQDSGLTCSAKYNYSVKYRNGDGVETSVATLSQNTEPCVSEGGSSVDAPRPPDLPNSSDFNPTDPDQKPSPPAPSPYNPSGGFNLLLNGGARTISNPEVALFLFGGPDTKFMQISEDPAFGGVALEQYTPHKHWQLKNNSLGNHTIYIRYFTLYDVPSETISKSITLTTKRSTQTPPSCATTIVKTGDTLWALATRYLSQGSLYPVLVNLNKNTYPSLSANPGYLMPGWELKVECK